jgi:hypothetical protein
MAYLRFGRSKIKIKRLKAPSDRLLDMLGQRFGRLEVVAKAMNSKAGAARWVCRCDCNAKVRTIVRGDSLRSGTSRSCGCLNVEANRQRVLDRPKAEPKPRKPRAQRTPSVTSGGDWRVFKDAALKRALADLDAASTPKRRRAAKP